MTKGGKINRIEPQGVDLIDAKTNVRRIFVQAGWYPFFSRLGSSHLGVEKVFSLSFDEQKKMYGLKLQTQHNPLVKLSTSHMKERNVSKAKFLLEET